MLNELFLRGGPVLYVLFFVTLIIFYILIEKYRFIFFNSESWLKLKLSEFKKEFPPETTDYKFVESVLLASVSRESKTNIKMLEGLISMCPMIGLLGTVYGMIEVFEVLSFLGTGNPRAMSSGVAMATIPTMSGMVITLFGLYFYQDLNGRINSLSSNFKLSLRNEGYKL
tara:strand:+ start:10 stop:519 length:510 start_codon:yes stop_codon:yes gene_type:complete